MLNSSLKKIGPTQIHHMTCLKLFACLKNISPDLSRTNSNQTWKIQVFKRRTSRPLLPPKFGYNLNRSASFLEQKLLPVLRTDTLQLNSLDGKSSQLTIFYNGAININDNVSVDKAQAIMLLAGDQSCLSKPVVTEMPKTEVRIPSHPSSNFPSINSKLKKGIIICSTIIND